MSSPSGSISSEGNLDIRPNTEWKMEPYRNKPNHAVNLTTDYIDIDQLNMTRTPEDIRLEKIRLQNARNMDTGVFDMDGLNVGAGHRDRGRHQLPRNSVYELVENRKM